jgi:hypothetical protein
MPALLTTASVLQCPHGGMVSTTPADSNSVVDAPIIAGTDTSIIAGCAFNVSGSPHPCVSVQWSVTGTRVKRSGAMALNASSVGLCLAADQAPQGTVLISNTQASVSGQ